MKNMLYMGTNTKMYKTIAETERFLKSLAELTADIPRSELTLFVIPSYTTLDRARKTVSRDVVQLGAQNMCWEEQGQFTGEISPLMLKEVGTDIVEIGHSERRHVFGETDEQENLKVLSAVAHGFTALLCIGETEQDKDSGRSDEVLCRQLEIGLRNLNPDRTNRLWIAYEPVWAIGVNGKPAKTSYAEEKHGVIRSELVRQFGEKGKEIPVLYGGSVNSENAPSLIQAGNIDGLFIGRSAWDAENFNRIIRDVLPLWKRKAK